MAAEIPYDTLRQYVTTVREAAAQSLDRLLASFVADKRMKLPGGSEYKPCYRLVK